jgi:hypothetical protein
MEMIYDLQIFILYLYESHGWKAVEEPKRWLRDITNHPVCATNKKIPFLRGADGVRDPYEWIA